MSGVNKWCRVPQYGPSSLGRRGRTKHPNKTFRDGVLTLCWRTLNNNDFRRYGSYVWSSLLLLFCTFVLFVSLVRGWTTSILPQGKGHLVHSCCLARVLLLSSPASGNTQVGGAPPQTFVCVYGLRLTGGANCMPSHTIMREHHDASCTSTYIKVPIYSRCCCFCSGLRC